MYRKGILLLTMLLLVAGASCAPVDKADKQSQQVCSYLVLFEKSMDELRVAENFEDQNAVKAQFEVARMNFNDLVQSASALEMAEQDDFEVAVNQLMETVDKLPEDATVPETLQQLQEPMQDVAVAAENLKAGLNCVEIFEDS